MELASGIPLQELVARDFVPVACIQQLIWGPVYNLKYFEFCPPDCQAIRRFSVVPGL
jgi:hypothetical protein